VKRQIGIGQKGFTLLELVVAAALSGILLITVAVLLGRGFTVWQRTDARLQQLFLTEKGLDMLGQELRNGVVLADLPFEGLPEQLFFTSVSDPTHLLQLRYKIESVHGTETLVRESQPYPAAESPLQVKPIIPRVKVFSLKYGVLQEANGQQSVRWLDTWKPTSAQMLQLPKLLQVRIETADSQGKIDSVIREFRIPQGVLGSASVES